MLRWLLGKSCSARKLKEYYGYDEVVDIFYSFHNPMLRSVALNQLRVLQDMNKVLER